MIIVRMTPENTLLFSIVPKQAHDRLGYKREAIVALAWLHEFLGAQDFKVAPPRFSKIRSVTHTVTLFPDVYLTHGPRNIGMQFIKKWEVLGWLTALLNLPPLPSDILSESVTDVNYGIFRMPLQLFQDWYTSIQSPIRDYRKRESFRVYKEPPVSPLPPAPSLDLDTCLDLLGAHCAVSRPVSPSPSPVSGAPTVPLGSQALSPLPASPSPVESPAAPPLPSREARPSSFFGSMYNSNGDLSEDPREPVLRGRQFLG